MNSIPSTGLSKHEKPKCARHRTGRDPSDLVEPLLVSPKIAWRLLNCSNTRGYELLGSGELESFTDGKSRKIVLASIKALITRRLTAEPKKRQSTWTDRATAARAAKRKAAAMKMEGA